MTDTSKNNASKRASTLTGFPDEATRAEVGIGHNGGPALSDPEIWFQLINEREAGAFLGLTDRTMQSYRQCGRGPSFIRISSRCIRYRRFDLKVWAEARMRSSTSDNGEEAA